MLLFVWHSFLWYLRSWPLGANSFRILLSYFDSNKANEIESDALEKNYLVNTYRFRLT